VLIPFAESYGAGWGESRQMRIPDAFAVGLKNDPH